MARRQGPREVYRVAGLIALIKDHQLACSEGCQSHVRRKTAPILYERGPSFVAASVALCQTDPDQSGASNATWEMREIHFFHSVIHTALFRTSFYRSTEARPLRPAPRSKMASMSAAALAPVVHKNQTSRRSRCARHRRRRPVHRTAGTRRPHERPSRPVSYTHLTLPTIYSV